MGSKIFCGAFRADLRRKLRPSKALYLRALNNFVPAPVRSFFHLIIGGRCWWERTLLMLTVLLVILVLALLGVLPAWPYSHAWGYYPSGGLGILLIIVIILLLL